MSIDFVEKGGARIPKIGLGTMQNEGEECVEIVQTALEMGYRHIDTAQAYGNEASVGEGIAAADVDREEVFLTTKVWRSNFRHDDVIESVHESLNRFDLDYIDLLLMHWPHPRIPLKETLSAMETLREEGLVSYIGVSNFTSGQLEKAVRITDAPIVADQVLCNPYSDQTDLQDTCRETDVALTAYSPLARGAVLDDEVLVEIGERYDKSPAQVALRWLVQQDGVVAIPKASSREHLEANLDVFDFSLSAEEMGRIDDLKPGVRTRLYNLMPWVIRRIPV